MLKPEKSKVWKHYCDGNIQNYELFLLPSLFRLQKLILRQLSLLENGQYVLCVNKLPSGKNLELQFQKLQSIFRFDNSYPRPLRVIFFRFLWKLELVRIRLALRLQKVLFLKILIRQLLLLQIWQS